MSRVHSLEPLIGRDPRILILGSTPSVLSVQHAQYYGNPRNAFWSIMAALFGIDVDRDYAQRIQQFKERPLALWDTIKVCHRQGSLDSNILRDQLEANDIPSLLRTNTHIRAIVFNGAVSEKYFKQLVLSQLPLDHGIELIRLPSTSPANAGMRFEEKVENWRGILRFLN